MVAVQLSEDVRLLTVKVTWVVPSGYGPTGSTVKISGACCGSVEPPSKSRAEALPSQLASALTVTDWHTAIGASLQEPKGSVTVTTVVQVEIFPLESVTVKVTVFSPISEQLKVTLSIAILAIPQESELPLSISDIVMLAFPLASN